MFWVGFGVGMLIGFFVAAFVLCLCHIAAEGDRVIERASSLEQESG